MTDDPITAALDQLAADREQITGSRLAKPPTTPRSPGSSPA